MLGVPADCFATDVVLTSAAGVIVLDMLNELLHMSLNDPIVFDIGNRDLIGALFTIISSSSSVQLSSASSIKALRWINEGGSSCNVVIRIPNLPFPGDATNAMRKKK